MHAGSFHELGGRYGDVTPASCKLLPRVVAVLCAVLACEGTDMVLHGRSCAEVTAVTSLRWLQLLPALAAGIKNAVKKSQSKSQNSQNIQKLEIRLARTFVW